MARQGKAGQGRARQSSAGQGQAGQGRARQDKARQGRARQVSARQGMAKQRRARQGMAKQGKSVRAARLTTRVEQQQKLADAVRNIEREKRMIWLQMHMIPGVCGKSVVSSK